MMHVTSSLTHSIPSSLYDLTYCNLVTFALVLVLVALLASK